MSPFTHLHFILIFFSKYFQNTHSVDPQSLWKAAQRTADWSKLSSTSAVPAETQTPPWRKSCSSSPNSTPPFQQQIDGVQEERRQLHESKGTFPSWLMSFKEHPSSILVLIPTSPSVFCSQIKHNNIHLLFLTNKKKSEYSTSNNINFPQNITYKHKYITISWAGFFSLLHSKQKLLHEGPLVCDWLMQRWMEGGGGQEGLPLCGWMGIIWSSVWAPSGRQIWHRTSAEPVEEEEAETHGSAAAVAEPFLWPGRSLIFNTVGLCSIVV